MTKVAELRKLINGTDIVVMPGAYDALSAKIIDHSGFPAIFTSGFGISASELGVPDFGLLTMSESLDRVHHIVNAVSVPVVADMDTGYGNPINVVRMAQECVRLGVSGIILEDQVWPKKCGHMEGKNVIPMEEHVQKIRAASYARGNGDLVIIARTDAVAPLGLEEAIMRGQAYVEAGADVIFIEAPESIGQLSKISDSFHTPLFANMIEGGKTPFLSARQLKDLGFKMVVYPLSGLFAATSAIQGVMQHLKSTGSTTGYDRMVSFSEFEKVVNLEKFLALESRFSAK